MTIPMEETTPRRRSSGRSIAAVLLGFVAVVVLSLATDQILHVLKVYPSWGQPMPDPGDNALALAYRGVYGVVGGYLAARFAPRAPMHHALILGAIGTVMGAIGAAATIPMNLGPAWYPIALALSGLPTAWLGGRLFLRRQAAA